jgi:3-methyladenine DNA glycosylase AlkD
MKIINRLLKLKDKKYAEFQKKLIPNIDSNSIIGIRVPDLRNIAKEYIKEAESKQFLNTLPHKYYEENMLHGLLISEIKDYDNVIEELDKFLFYVDNWAVCDIMSPKVFKKNKDKLIIKIKEWISSKHLYTSRFGIEMLMSHYLDKDFKKEYLELVSVVNTNEYYLQMMIAWFFATALAKQWESTIIYLEKNKLDRWVHNKTIQKAIESYRITDVQKEYLKSLKR